MLSAANNFFEKLNPVLVFVLGGMLLFLIAFLDFFTGSEISFSIFYLIPICLVGWYGSRNVGLIFALISATAWMLIEVKGNTYSSFSIPYWNGFVRFSFFLIIVMLITYIRNINYSLSDIVKKRTVQLSAEIAERKKAQEETTVVNRQLGQLAMNFQQEKEEENLRISREIHDELGQILTGLKIDIAWLGTKFNGDIKARERIASMTELVNDTFRTVRRIATHLRPRLLDDLGLIPAMEMQVREFQTKTGIRCNIDMPKLPLAINKINTINIFRVFQEALTNIVKHANATHVNITVDINSENFVMLIKDNGIGINNASQEQTLGVLGMKERVNLLNGNIALDNSAEGGALIKVQIPLSKLVEAE